VRAYLEDQRVETDASARELGFQTRSLRVGLTQTIEWLATARPVERAA